MGDVTKIAWCDATFNHVIGCTKVAPGCQFCYAEADMDKRRHRVKWGPNGTRVVTTEGYWKKPLKWNRDAERTGTRTKVFCASLADVFEDWGGEVLCGDGVAHFTSDTNPSMVATNTQMMGCDSVGYHYTTLEDCRKRLFRLSDTTPWLDWLILTKRPENVLRMWPFVSGLEDHEYVYRNNVWIGTSVSDQETADRAVPQLLMCRHVSPVLFLSVEPLLGEIDLRKFIDPSMDQHGDGRPDWVIIGGESGQSARPCRQTWIRDIVRQCQDADVPCFVKQFGSNAEEGFGVHRKLRLKDSKGGDMEEWPADLRVREFPQLKVKAD